MCYRNHENMLIRFSRGEELTGRDVVCSKTLEVKTQYYNYRSRK